MVHAPRSIVLLEIVLLLITSPHAAATAEAGSGSGFASGGVCADVAPDAGAHTALVGKHLVIGELWWGPFAIPDSTAPYGWTGFNIDLIEEMSEMLGFTFEIRDIGYPLANETWTTMIFRAIDDTDLTMSFWIKNGARLKQIEFLEGHIDFSPGLVARRAQKEDLSYWTWENLSSFMRPFTWLLWSALVGMVLVSGVADFIIERARTKDASLTASLYEYCAGFLWGGFEYPLSKASAVFQIILGFLLLIVVATYTANLASFIVLGAVPGLSCSSVETAMLNSKIIVTEDGGYLERISSTFPRLQYETVFGCGGGAECMSNRVLGITTPKGQGADAGVLADGALTPKLYYQQWKSSTDTRDTCSLEWVQTLFADTAGWVASRRSMCVRTAIEWAFYQLARRGTIERLHIKYFPAKQPSPPARRLADESDTTWAMPLEMTPAGAPSDAGRTDTTTPERRRRLKGAGGSDTANLPPGVSQTGVNDLLGLFLVWWGVIAILIAWTYVGPFVLRKVCRKPIKVTAKEDGIDDTENERLMLRELLRHVREMRGIHVEDKVDVVKESGSRIVNFLERRTGFDIDGDGDTGVDNIKKKTPRTPRTASSEPTRVVEATSLAVVDME